LVCLHTFHMCAHQQPLRCRQLLCTSPATQPRNLVGVSNPAALLVQKSRSNLSPAMRACGWQRTWASRHRRLRFGCLARGCQALRGGTRTPGPVSCTVFVWMTRVTQTWRILCQLASRASRCDVQQGQTTQRSAVSQAAIRQECEGCQSCFLVMNVWDLQQVQGAATMPGRSGLEPLHG
jgi:hypothetical protein